MAASKASSSLAWVTDFDKLQSILEDSFVTEESLMDCIAENCIKAVLSGIIQLKYWRKKLEPQLDSRTVVLACLGPSGLIKPNISELFKIMEAKVGEENILSVYYSENEKFSGLNFESVGAAEQARQGGATLGEALICYICPGPVNVHEVRVLWAPAFTPLDSICQLFDKYALDINISFETVNVKPGRHLPSNIASGKITLREGISVGDIPHIIKLPDNKNTYLLVIIRYRPPLCLKCRMVGHYRKQCSHVHCSQCKTTHDKSHPCKERSYASAVSNISQATNLIMEESKGSSNESEPYQLVMKRTSFRKTVTHESGLACQDGISLLHKAAGATQLESMGHGRSSLPERASVTSRSIFQDLPDLMEEGVSDGEEPCDRDLTPLSITDIEDSGVHKYNLRNKNKRGRDNSLPPEEKKIKVKKTKDSAVLSDEHVGPDAHGDLATVAPSGDWATELEAVLTLEEKDVFSKDGDPGLRSEGGGLSLHVSLDEMASQENGLVVCDSDTKIPPCVKSDIFLQFEGFSPQDRSAQLLEFLGDHDVEEITYLEDLGVRLGTFIVKFPSVDLAKEALAFDGMFFEGKKISVFYADEEDCTVSSLDEM